jgi:hypothetical protein
VSADSQGLFFIFWVFLTDSSNRTSCCVSCSLLVRSIHPAGLFSLGDERISMFYRRMESIRLGYVLCEFEFVPVFSVSLFVFEKYLKYYFLECECGKRAAVFHLIIRVYTSATTNTQAFFIHYHCAKNRKSCQPMDHRKNGKTQQEKKIWNGMPMFNVAICFLGLGCFVYFLFCFSFSRMLERSGVSVFHLFGFACVKLGLCTVGTWKRSS